MSQDNLIPFGKYKGQPIEAIAEDKQYLDWLTQQPWFREKHVGLYQIVINNFCDPSETPEHNALQARFLDDDFRLKFASIAIPRLWWHARMDGEMIDQLATAAAAGMAEVSGEIRKAYEGFEYRSKNGIPTCNILVSTASEWSTSRDDQKLFFMSGPGFEVNGVDCRFECCAGAGFCITRSDRPGDYYKQKTFSIGGTISIEIKPEIGDDYPAILRQMRRNGSKILFTRGYVGSGVDEPTFLRFMESQKIQVIFEHEVDAAEKIQVDEFDKANFLATVEAKREILEL